MPMGRFWLVRMAYTLIYRRWIVSNGKPGRVYRVTGWRSALVDYPSGRRHEWPCFWWFD